MAVVDVYDALIAQRIYKPAIPNQEALKIIRRARGSHFDPEILDGMLAIEASLEDIATCFTNGPSQEKYSALNRDFS